VAKNYFATEAQERFIRNLDRQLGYDSDERYFDVMTCAEASELITALKAELGVGE